MLSCRLNNRCEGLRLWAHPELGQSLEKAGTALKRGPIPFFQIHRSSRLSFVSEFPLGAQAACVVPMKHGTLGRAASF